jgi:hypothetical protein
MNENLIRHLLATLAYRTTKAIREVPDGYSDLSIGADVRTPVEILHHMSDVLLFAYRALVRSERMEIALAAWETEVERFYDDLDRLDEAIACGIEPKELSWEQLLQGPLSDVMTHVGQLAMLRRLAGDPILGENFSRADIQIGNIRPM